MCSDILIHLLQCAAPPRVHAAGNDPDILQTWKEHTGVVPLCSLPQRDMNSNSIDGVVCSSHEQRPLACADLCITTQAYSLFPLLCDLFTSISKQSEKMSILFDSECPKMCLSLMSVLPGVAFGHASFLATHVGIPFTEWHVVIIILRCRFRLPAPLPVSQPHSACFPANSPGSLWTLLLFCHAISALH